MKKHFLLKRLMVPLSTAGALSMLAAFGTADPWRSLFVNLTATFLGSMVTVFYVEVILRRDEQRQWAMVMGHVGKHVNVLGNAAISSIRQALRLPLPPAFDDFEAIKDPATVRRFMIQLADSLLQEITSIADMDQEAWRSLANNLRSIMQNCERIIALFGANLDPVITNLVLDVAEKAQDLLGHYQIIPDLLGVPFEQLKPNRFGKSMVPYVRATLQLTIRDARQLLEICTELLRQVGMRFPERKL
jgi:hypothetical protein